MAGDRPSLPATLAGMLCAIVLLLPAKATHAQSDPIKITTHTHVRLEASRDYIGMEQALHHWTFDLGNEIIRVKSASEHYSVQVLDFRYEEIPDGWFVRFDCRGGLEVNLRVEGANKAQVSLIWEKETGSESEAILTGDFFVNYDVPPDNPIMAIF